MKTLLDIPKDREREWVGMPDFKQRNLMPFKSIIVHFSSVEDQEQFAQLIGQTVTHRTRSIWFPKAKITRYVDKRYFSQSQINPRYPIYIVSKGRWESRLTARALERIKVPYHIVVEPQELKAYAKVIDQKKILVLPFSNLGKGSIPARNWIWQHAFASGAERHWILDDNIRGFYRLNDNLKVEVQSGSTFRAAEDFADRYSNVGLAGMNYFMFAPRKSPSINPFTLNTRIYSCILIRNDLPYRWRGRYNEDTDLSLRVLKAGLCTVLFNTFLIDKVQTMTMAGGNTDELYQGDGRLRMAKSLQKQHGNLVEIKKKWGRWQHSINYRPFAKNRLKLKEGVSISSERDNYGMELDFLMNRKSNA